VSLCRPLSFRRIWGSVLGLLLLLFSSVTLINVKLHVAPIVYGYIPCPVYLVIHKAPYTLLVKLRDFTVWRHTWRKNRANCAVLTGSSAAPRNVFSSRLSHRELRSSLRECHSFLSLPADTTMASSYCNEQNWQRNWQTCLETCAVPEDIQFSF
jgi:hypothetical protein